MSAHIGPWILVISTVFAGTGLLACTASEPRALAPSTNAPKTTETTERVSATDEQTAPVSESTMSAPVLAAGHAAQTDDSAPTGQLVCRTTSDGNAHQIFLEWNGDTAKGTLRTSTPSGMVRQEPIRAERYKARIIIDDPNSDDVAVHKATMVEDRKGKQIQLGDNTHAWTPCN